MSHTVAECAERRARILALRAEGWKIDAIAAEIGVTRTAVDYHLRHNRPVRAFGERTLRMVAARASGLKFREIAEAEGVNISAVYAAVVRMSAR